MLFICLLPIQRYENFNLKSIAMHYYSCYSGKFSVKKIKKISFIYCMKLFQQKHKKSGRNFRFFI
jgi:hypothetical protein